MTPDDYDSRYRCRYCGAPCRDGGVCHAHSDIHRLDGETMEAAQQLSLADVIALENAERSAAAPMESPPAGRQG